MQKHPLYLVVSDTARNPARSGIQMVVRALVAALARQAPERTRLVRWWMKSGGMLALLAPNAAPDLGDAGALREAARFSWRERLRSDWRTRLLGGWWAAHRLGLNEHLRHRERLREAWLLLPELAYRHASGADRPHQLVTWARQHGMRVAAVLYDLIAIRHPEFTSPAHAELHAGYLAALARMDVLLPISQTVADDWHAWADAQPADAFGGPDGRRRPEVCAVPLAAELPGVARVREAHATTAEPDTLPRALCVSTVEPRKNHAALLTALDHLAEKHGGRLPLRLDLVGAAHPAGQEIVAAIQAAAERYPGQVTWHGQVDDETRRALYAACDFTVYPSVIEGFGLPVMESLWLGRPCICARDGAVGENAAGGGCLLVDVRDPAVLAGALEKLALDAAMRARLAAEAVARPLRTWDEYATDVLAALR